METTTRKTTLGTILILAAAAMWCASAAAAASLPKMPGELQVTKSAESPGQVTFNHASHVDDTRPSCTGCHPREFRILKSKSAAAPIRHADMEKGRQCGKCHDGKTSFNMTDDCAMCHK